MNDNEGFGFEPETLTLVALFTQCIGAPLDEDEKVETVAGALESMDKATMGMVIIDLMTAFVHAAQELKRARNGA